MKNLIIITILTFLSFRMDCQPSTKNEVIHLVMANIEGFDGDLCCHETYIDLYDENNGIDLAPTYLNLLFRIEHDTLFLIDTLNINPSGKYSTDNMIHVKDGKWIYLSERSRYDKEDFYNTDDDWVTVLDYSKSPIHKRRFNKSLKLNNIEISNYYVSGILKDNKTEIYNSHEGEQIITRYTIDKNIHFTAINVQDPIEFSPYGTGGYSNADKNFFINRYFLDTLGNLALRWQKLDQGIKPPSAQFKVPERYLNPKYHNFFKLVINNGSSNWMVGRGGRDLVNSDTLIVYDKKNNKWSQTIKLPDFFSLDIYKDFIYGTEASFIWNLDSISSDTFEKSITDYIKRGSTKYAPAPFILDHTGKLFIYHIPSKKMIKWDNKDLDSEMLTVKDGWIYYRVFDEIRKVPLDEMKVKIVWDKQEIVIKNVDVIPHVHNIFWAPKKDHIVEEWITPKPEKKKSKGLPKRINN